ncbi:MAG TPA: alpha/beta hydrolase [Hyphomicrobiaceae bacterium]
MSTKANTRGERHAAISNRYHVGSTRNGPVAPESFTRIPITLQHRDDSAYTETYGFTGNQGMVTLEGQLLKPPVRTSNTLFVFQHPTSTLHLLPMPIALAEAGFDVLCGASRYAKNDSSLIMEKVVLDLGSWIKLAREELHYEKVVLVGWSGGGSLSLFYQAEAESPTITHTPAGDPVDLTIAGLQPADGVIFIAAHLSRAETLTEWLDPSVVDEANPEQRDAQFDIYAPNALHQPPFDAEYVRTFRAAQVARNRRITAWVQTLLEDMKRRRGPEVERPFVVHRTMCDPRWIDPQLDPNDRRPNWCYMGDPRTVNVSAVGLARFNTLRSWLSQWAYDLSNARSSVTAPRIRKTPVLQIENSADDAVPATHNPTIYQALATPHKEYYTLKGATHYYLGQPDHLAQCIAYITSWVERNGLLAGHC